MHRAAQAAAVTVVLALLGLLIWHSANQGATNVTAGQVAPLWTKSRVDTTGTLSLASLRGKVVVLNFWATWCEPCRLEMPSLDAMAARRRGEGVAVAAVNYRERADVVQRYLEGASFRSPVLLDSDGDATFAWTPRVFPTTVIVGRRGQPVHVVVGELDWEGAEARALIDPLVLAPGRA
jgi:thiol-disulfide isomerase/thioredoxin